MLDQRGLVDCNPEALFCGSVGFVCPLDMAEGPYGVEYQVNFCCLNAGLWAREQSESFLSHYTVGIELPQYVLVLSLCTHCQTRAARAHVVHEPADLLAPGTDQSLRLHTTQPNTL